MATQDPTFGGDSEHHEWVNAADELASSWQVSSLVQTGLSLDMERSEATNLVESGVIGAEFAALEASSLKPSAPLPKMPHKDPYHGRVKEPKTLLEPRRESFNVMVVGEAGLGKTTLLESFFKSFKDDEAAFALFERRETQKVIETRRLLDEACVRRDAAEREMKAAVETAQYALAQKKKCEIASEVAEIARVGASLKELCASDERKRYELRALRERARHERWEMKRAADEHDFGAAGERQLSAAVVQLECDAVQMELKQLRRPRESAASSTDGEGDEGEDDAAGREALSSATVRVSAATRTRTRAGRAADGPWKGSDRVPRVGPREPRDVTAVRTTPDGAPPTKMVANC